MGLLDDYKKSKDLSFFFFSLPISNFGENIIDKLLILINILHYIKLSKKCKHIPRVTESSANSFHFLLSSIFELYYTKFMK